MRLRITNQRVEWETGSLELQAPALGAILLGDAVLVIHDYMNVPRDGNGSNLVCYSLSGERQWSAELPGRDAKSEAYVGFLSEDPLWAYDFTGYRCRIDPATGKLLAAEFSK